MTVNDFLTFLENSGAPKDTAVVVIAADQSLHCIPLGIYDKTQEAIFLQIEAIGVSIRPAGIDGSSDPSKLN